MKKVILILACMVGYSFAAGGFYRDTQHAGTTAQAIVVDTNTGLTWEDDPAVKATAGLPSWISALNFCSVTLNAGAGYAGYTDWRLPNINELKSLIDYTKGAAPVINSTFVNTAANNYWSSTGASGALSPTPIGAPTSGFAWTVSFAGAGIYTTPIAAITVNVRCVRGHQ